MSPTERTPHVPRTAAEGPASGHRSGAIGLLVEDVGYDLTGGAAIADDDISAATIAPRRTAAPSFKLVIDLLQILPIAHAEAWTAPRRP